MINDKKIQGHTDLVKRKNAIVNTNSEAYLEAKKRRERAKQIDEVVQKTESLGKKVEEIDQKLSLIISLLGGNKE